MCCADEDQLYVLGQQLEDGSLHAAPRLSHAFQDIPLAMIVSTASILIAVTKKGEVRRETIGTSAHSISQVLQQLAGSRSFSRVHFASQSSEAKKRNKK